MKVLWIVNMVLPQLAEFLNIQTSASGTWMDDLSKKLDQQQNIELGVACVFGTEYKEIKCGATMFYLIPGDGKSMLLYTKRHRKYWKMIHDSFMPDLVHIHGTEYSHALSYIRQYPKDKYLLTIQGIINKIADKNDGQLPLGTQLRYHTFREMLHLNGMIEMKLLMKYNRRYENEIIRSVQYATGRTDWDKAYMQKVNPGIKYYRVWYNLRAPFYECRKWNIENSESYKIYASTSASLPLKGGHVVLQALSVVKKRYPKVKAVFIAPSDGKGHILPKSGYTKFIGSLIRKYGLEDNAVFVDRLTAQQVIEEMLTSRVCVIPSAMENASATLREAMALGVPSIASFRGGMEDLIQNGVNGCYFDYEEPEYLAQKIMDIFDDDSFAETLSRNAVITAEKWHDREKNVQDMMNVYDTIMRA